MGAVITQAEPGSLVLHFGAILRNMSDHEFYEFCRLNPELRIERTSDGDLVIMPPTGGNTGRLNSALAGLVGTWAAADGTGVAFDSSTGFWLPNGAERSPDLAWVKRSRWDALTPEQQEEFPPLCPDFVAEIRSRTDALRDLKAKMEEYVANGAQLGWLIDPLEKRLYVYRPSAEPCCLDNPATISGDPVLPGFVLDLQKLWA